jgi:hypothetical protein
MFRLAAISDPSQWFGSFAACGLPAQKSWKRRCRIRRMMRKPSSRRPRCRCPRPPHGSSRSMATNLLVATDKSGVFNAAALPVAGGDEAPLTTSATDRHVCHQLLPEPTIAFSSPPTAAATNSATSIVREADGALKDLTPGDKHIAPVHRLAGDGKTFWIGDQRARPADSSTSTPTSAADLLAEAGLREQRLLAPRPSRPMANGWRSTSRPRRRF